MAATVFELSLRVMVFTLTIAIVTVPAYADQKPFDIVRTRQLEKEELFVKTTASPSSNHESRKAAYPKYEAEFRNHITIEPLKEEMETVAAESTSKAAHCHVGETAAMDLGSILDDGEGVLVTLVAGDTRLMAHKAVLAARSPVFAAMLCQGTQESRSGQVVIPDVEGPVLRQLVAYLYTLKAPQLHSMDPQLLAAADKFGLSALKASCEVQLASQLSVDTAVSTAVLAIRHSSTSLKQATIAFIKAHLLQIITTQGWAHAVHNQPEEVSEVYRLLSELPVETSPHDASMGSTPAAADSQPTTEGPSLSRSNQGQTLPDSESLVEVENQLHNGHRPTPPADDDVIPRLRIPSAEEKGRRLLEAAKEKRVAEVQALVTAGADVGARDEGLRTALHWAADRGLLEAARILVGAGAEVDTRDDTQRTPLHEAARFGHADVARLLLASSAYVDARDQDQATPLHLAAYAGNAEAAAVLLQAGADTAARDKLGRTPPDMAREERQQQLIDMLA